MQQIIVYRNPGEAAVWDFIMSANGFVFMVSVAFMFCTILVADHFLPFWIKRKFPYLSLVISVIAAGLIIFIM